MKIRNLTITVLAVIVLIAVGYAVTLYVVEDEQRAPQAEVLTRHQLEIGRDDVDIQSTRTYVFDLPARYRYEAQGVDAQSLELWFFNESEVQVMTAVVYDHTSVNWIAADPNNTQVAGHTIMIVQADDQNLLSRFKQTLTVDGEQAYQ